MRTATLGEDRARSLPPLVARPIVLAMAAQAVLLTVLSNQYGFHRDELYFRMLQPAWGYVDQPPLTPLLVRWFSRHVADEPWAIHIPATICAVLSVLVVVLITRELGGGRTAQTLCAWAYAFAATPLIFGHVMLTSSIDLVVWPLVTLLIIRALLRDDPRWWVVAGVVVGLSMYNKLLIAMLLAAFAIGVALVGPRQVLRSPWVWGSTLLALAIGLPNIVYQATNDWPELTMGQALADNNSGDVRVLMWPFLLILLGPPLAVICWRGLVTLWRRPDYRPVRFLAIGFPVFLAMVFVAGTQLYYPAGYLAILFAVGCVPVAERIDGPLGWRNGPVQAIALNSVICALIALPLVPVAVLGSTPIGAVNQTARDSVGWPAYVEQIASVYDDLPAAERSDAVVVTGNYGEAGAVDRYGPAVGLPAVYSAQNELYFQARPPDATHVVVFVGDQEALAARWFSSCTIEARLDNGEGVDNEEQDQPIAVCRGPNDDWPTIWASLQHYD